MLEEAEKKKTDGVANGEVPQTTPALQQNPARNENGKKPKSAKAKKSD